MEWLNYHHLLYFWTVAREGSVTRASQVLHLAQPTVSGQLKALEDSLGEKLFARQGRRLVLTDVGRMVYGYADEIFALGRELMDTLKDRPTGRPLRLVVGVADVVPKLVAHSLLEPALNLPEHVHIVVREDRPERLLADLAVHALDLVIADAPISPAARVKAFNHLLGECGVGLFGTAELVEPLRAGFPDSLDGVPLLLPSESTSLRRSVEQWLDARNLRPRIVGEFEDSALMKTFAQAGRGLFPAPTVVQRDIERSHGMTLLGEVEGARESFYAISVERRLKHPAVLAISEAARHRLFA
jgi:LysR family transcriptional activator of nhaA